MSLIINELAFTCGRLLSRGCRPLHYLLSIQVASCLNPPDMNCFVTGASGFIGANLVQELVARGHRVKALLRSTSDLRGLAGVDFERVNGDVNDRAALRRRVAGMRLVLPCRGQLSSLAEGLCADVRRQRRRHAQRFGGSRTGGLLPHRLHQHGGLHRFARFLSTVTPAPRPMKPRPPNPANCPIITRFQNGAPNSSRGNSRPKVCRL